MIYSLIRNLFHIAMIAMVIEGARRGELLAPVLIVAGYSAVSWREVGKWAFDLGEVPSRFVWQQPERVISGGGNWLGSSGEGNWNYGADGLGGGLPAFDFAHHDLTRRQLGPEQHRRGFGGWQHGLHLSGSNTNVSCKKSKDERRKITYACSACFQKSCILITVAAAA